MFFFFFKQKTAYEMRISDWSSDVCSSDLLDLAPLDLRLHQLGKRLVVAVVEAARIEFAGLGIDDVLGEIEHLALDLQVGEVVEYLLRRAHLVVEVQRAGDQPRSLGPQQQAADAAEQHRARYRRHLLAPHPLQDRTSVV